MTDDDQTNQATSQNNAHTSSPSRIEIYDTTLRDGTQGHGVSLSLQDKLNITQALDQLGVDYVEGGYPLSNPKDEAYFQQIQDIPLKHTKVCAFGMTRRKNIAAADDVGMQALVGAGSPIITIVGKTWDLHVDEVLHVERQENLDMIHDSVAFCRSADHVEAVFYDAEHFFDGYRANPDYAMQTLNAAITGGASRLVLCDTNGGTLPNTVAQIVAEIKAALGDDIALGIHPHNDSGVAVANALVAVEAGAVQVQGTINGIGERCGNVDLTTVIANLKLKCGLTCLEPNGDQDALARLTEISRYVYELANMNLQDHQPYVGAAAFAHKGGMHVHAVNRLACSYEHIEPQRVGNRRQILVSELSGLSNVQALIDDRFDEIKTDRDRQRQVLEQVQDLENVGYQFEAAKASFELLLYQALGKRRPYWQLDHYRCVILKNNDHIPVTEATAKIVVGDQVHHEVAEGDGPVNALDGALRRCLEPVYPALKHIGLRDFKVRVVNADDATAAKVRVVIDFGVDDEHTPLLHRTFSTIGVDENIVNASWQALSDAFEYYLIESSIEPIK